ncbi:MAG: methylenetetrahydrofolate--tRNA-(uracil(54)-C(5))-methyltransferase (FADH(2)-oxidizing) TrmFO, partial [Mariprofundaceae bacterium]|nr:methylenetetrahydrofolate--tRNA-(uracil(54)-C(5))-methyltransferase (FADH(2)-oxidizing) TrmFO [Mariprofundaceae bacterium]
EGYVESAASGLMAGRFLAATVAGKAPNFPPATTAHGGLLGYVSGCRKDDFQPMNINFGLLPLGPKRDGKRRLGKMERRLAVSQRALNDLQKWLDNLNQEEK